MLSILACAQRPGKLFVAFVSGQKIAALLARLSLSAD
jgi:hypothetical protein